MKKAVLPILFLIPLTAFPLIKQPVPPPLSSSTQIALEPATAPGLVDLESSLKKITSDRFANDIFNEYVEAVSRSYEIKPTEAVMVIVEEWVKKCAKTKIQYSASTN